MIGVDLGAHRAVRVHGLRTIRSVQPAVGVLCETGLDPRCGTGVQVLTGLEVDRARALERSGVVEDHHVGCPRPLLRRCHRIGDEVVTAGDAVGEGVRSRVDHGVGLLDGRGEAGAGGDELAALVPRRERARQRPCDRPSVRASDGGRCGQAHHRGDAPAAGGRLQPHQRPGLGGELGDHVLAQVPGRHPVDLVQAGKAFVGGDDLDVGHADAVVDHRQLVAALAQGAPVDLHGGVRRREPQRVLDQLGQHVHEVDHDRAGQGGVAELAEPDPFEVLHLAHRRAHDLAQRGGLATSARGLGPGQDQQRLCVASHAAGQVVQLEEVLEEGGIGLPLLQRGDEVELATEEGLVASTEVRQGLGQVAAQDGLLAGQAQSGGLHVVERAGHLADLGGSGRPQRWQPSVAVAGLLAPHRLGQPDQGDVLGLSGELGQRTGDRPDGVADQEGADEQHADQGAEGHQQHLTARGSEGVDGVDGPGRGDVTQRRQVRHPLLGPLQPVVEGGGVDLGTSGRGEECLVPAEGRRSQGVAHPVDADSQVLVGNLGGLGRLDRLRSGQLRHLAERRRLQHAPGGQGLDQVGLLGSGLLRGCQEVGR